MKPVLFPSLDQPMDVPYGWVQWKGTSVCIDLHCQCGALLHYDGDFLYHVKCAHCGQVYEVSGYVRLHALDFEPKHTKEARDRDKWLDRTL